MPRGLAVETSGRVGSIAIVEDGKVVAEDTFSHGLQHAAQIICRIDALLKARQWQPRDLQELYLSIGPGSFTGLRIGVTLVKTLAFVTGARMAAVPTLDVLARNAPAEARNVIVVLDAKREQIFTARYSREETTSPWVITEPPHLDRLNAMLSRSPRPVHLIGEGIPYHRQFIGEDPQVIVTDAELWRARAAIVAELGSVLLREGMASDPQKLVPFYIRKPEAEERWEQQQSAGNR
ncbi:MAG TPA: tRNA (adenosine(37)-N6)-threonylcarbamoyltransferase complex dimerization subunit type 1 TsaB [Tepidisphaeraceae bacterium]|nr:tRNA (adenosine(37)-N6)-threonylcarbamoyltransferase complex dimerization subunit type 1 TsaB [Tepidisphaeraceae bacterium]